MEEQYIVFVKIDDAGYIIAVNSSAFLRETVGWIEIDRGYSEKYHHAQGNYFNQSIVTEFGAWRYKLIGGAVAECTPDEIAAQEALLPVPGLSDAERIAELEAALDLLLSGVTE